MYADPKRPLVAGPCRVVKSIFFPSTPRFYFAVQGVNIARGRTVRFRIRNITKLFQDDAQIPVCYSFGFAALGWRAACTDCRLYKTFEEDDDPPEKSAAKKSAKKTDEAGDPPEKSSGDPTSSQPTDSTATPTSSQPTAQQPVEEKQPLQQSPDNKAYVGKKTNRDKGADERNLYTFEFSYNFELSDDTVLFAFSHPYTYTHCLAVLQRCAVFAAAEPTIHFRRRRVCESLGGLPFEAVEVASYLGGPIERRPTVFVNARTHPGEPQGSWMFQGFLRFLLGDSFEAYRCREKLCGPDKHVKCG